MCTMHQTKCSSMKNKYASRNLHLYVYKNKNYDKAAWTEKRALYEKFK